MKTLNQPQPTNIQIKSPLHIQSTYKHSQQKQLSQIEIDIRIFLAGAFSGIISRTATSPFERIKVLRQTRNQFYAKVSFIKSLYIMGKLEGLNGYFKGNWTNIIRVAPFSALEFYTYDFLRMRLYHNQKSINANQSLLIGGLAGAVASTLTYPLDLIRTVFSLQVNTKEFNSIYSAIKKIFIQDGALGLYKGYLITILGITPFISIKMTTYNMIKKYYAEDWQKISPQLSLLLGAAAGLVAATLTYPTELLKRRLQAQVLKDTHQQYKGIIDCTLKIYQKEGITGFFAGLLPCYWKVVPSASIAFAANNSIKTYLGVLKKN